MRRRRSPLARLRALPAALALALAAAPAPAPAADQGPPPPRTPEELPLFERPAVERAQEGFRRLMRAGDVIAAERELRGLVSRWPALVAAQTALARLVARRGALDEAATRLLIAARAGLRGAEAVAALPEFAPLTERSDWPAIAEALSAPPPPRRAGPPPALPAPLIEGAAVVAEGSAEWSPEERAIRAYVVPPSEEAVAALSAGGAPEIVSHLRGEASRRVNRWFAEGRAAGNRGDLYENRDGGHSPLDVAALPQITPIEHGASAVEAGWDRGAAEGLAISWGREEAPPIIGNSSTAVVSGPLWRSMARRALTDPGGPAELWRQHASNQLYVYPEHKDHDGFFGDVFHAATPYMIVTQGSSWSDEAALEALALTLAAFRPETKRRLIEERLIAPTLQMLFRRAQQGIEGEADYLSPRAHPTAFDPERLDPLAMVERAQAMTPETIPPQVRLAMLREDRPTPSVTLFGDGLSETVFDTPAALARAFRGTEPTRRYVVSAAGTRDPNDRPLAFRWVLLRGDPEKVRLTPIGERGEAAEIEIDWHDATETPLQGLRSLRVDIGVFADNGAELSAPAFLSVAFPPRQRRSFDAAGRPEMIAYDAAELLERYADPRLWPLREWRDVYAWDAEGRPLGWRREGAGGFARFTRHGARVLRDDAEGRPLLAERTAYPLLPAAEARRRVHPAGRGDRLSYSYDGPQDRQGVARPAPDPDAPDAEAPAPAAAEAEPSR